MSHSCAGIHVHTAALRSVRASLQHHGFPVAPLPLHHGRGSHQPGYGDLPFDIATPAHSITPLLDRAHLGPSLGHLPYWPSSLPGFHATQPPTPSSLATNASLSVHAAMDAHRRHVKLATYS